MSARTRRRRSVLGLAAWLALAAPWAAQGAEPDAGVQGTGEQGSEQQGGGEQGGGEQGGGEQGGGEQGEQQQGTGETGSEQEVGGKQDAGQQSGDQQGSGQQGADKTGSNSQGSGAQGAGEGSSGQDDGKQSGGGPPPDEPGPDAQDAGSGADAHDPPPSGDEPAPVEGGTPPVPADDPPSPAGTGDTGDTGAPATADPPGAPAGPAGPTGVAAEPTGAAAAFDPLAPLGPRGLAGRFADLAARHPDHAVAGGIPIDGMLAPLLTLGGRTGPGPDGRPALLFAGWGDQASVDTALALAGRLLEPAQRSLLDRATVYLLPVLGPAPELGTAPVPARNFPVGWRPETVIPGSGPYPLAAPQARALAEFLQGRDNLVVLLALADGPCTGPEVSAILADAYRAELARLRAPAQAGGPVLAPSSLCPATAASYAWAACGVFPARIDEPQVLDALARPLALARAGAALEAVRSLPHLVVSDPTVEVLSARQVRVDLRVENTGALPTRSASAAAFGHAAPVELIVEGAAVLACASGVGGAVPSVQAPRAGRFPLGDIPGEGAIEVCLVLAVDHGTEVQLVFSAPRAGAVTRSVVVPR
jgi:hypothetical protein